MYQTTKAEFVQVCSTAPKECFDVDWTDEDFQALWYDDPDDDCEPEDQIDDGDLVIPTSDWEEEDSGSDFAPAESAYESRKRQGVTTRRKRKRVATGANPSTKRKVQQKKQEAKRNKDVVRATD